MTSLMTFAAFLESIVILVLAEPVLNRMSPCAPFAVRWAVHAVAIGSAIRIYHLLDGHAPSWSSLLQVGGFAALLLIHQIGALWCGDEKREGKRFEKKPEDLGLRRRHDDETLA